MKSNFLLPLCFHARGHYLDLNGQFPFEFITCFSKPYPYSDYEGNSSVYVSFHVPQELLDRIRVLYSQEIPL